MPAPHKTKPRWQKGLLWGLCAVLCAALAAGGVFYVSPRSKAAAARQLAAAVQARLGGRLSIHRVRPLGPLGFVVSGLVWAEGPSRRGPPIVAIDRLAVRVALLPLLRGRIRIEQLDVDGAVLAAGSCRESPPLGPCALLQAWQEPGEASAEGPPAPVQSPGSEGASPTPTTYASRLGNRLLRAVRLSLPAAHVRHARGEWRSASSGFDLAGLDVDVSAEGSLAGGHATLAGHAADLTLNAAHVPQGTSLGAVALSLPHISWRQDATKRALRIYGAGLSGAGSSLNASAQLGVEEEEDERSNGPNGVKDAYVQLELNGQIDLAAPIAPLWPALAVPGPNRGLAAVSLLVEAHQGAIAASGDDIGASRGHVALQVRPVGAAPLMVAGQAWRSLALALELNRGQAQLTSARLEGPAGLLAARGTAALTGSPASLKVGRHAFDLSLERGLLRQLGAPFLPTASARASARQWPREARVLLHLEGRKAWPRDQADTAIALTAEVRGTPALIAAQAEPAALLLDAHLAGEHVVEATLAARLGQRVYAHARGKERTSRHRGLEGHFVLEVPALTPLLAAAHTPLTGERLLLSGTLTGTRHRPVLAALLRGYGFGLHSGRTTLHFGDLYVPLSLVGDHLAVNNAELSGHDGSVRLAASAELQAPLGLSTALLHLNVENLAVPIGPGQVGRLQGSVLASSARGNPVVTSSLQLTSLPSAPHKAADGSRDLKVALLAQADRQGARLIALAAALGRTGQAVAEGRWPWPTANGQLTALRPSRGSPGGPLRFGSDGLRLSARRLPLLAFFAAKASAESDALPLNVDLSLAPARHALLALHANAQAPHGHVQADFELLSQQVGADGLYPIRGQSTVQLEPGPYVRALQPGPSPLLPGGLLVAAFSAEPKQGSTSLAAEVQWQRPTLGGQALAAGDLALAVTTPAARAIAATLESEHRGALDLALHATWPRARAWRLGLDVRELALAELLPTLHASGAALHARGHARLALANRALARPLRAADLAGAITLTALDAEANGQAMSLAAPATLTVDSGLASLSPLALQGTGGRLATQGTFFAASYSGPPPGAGAPDQAFLPAQMALNASLSGELSLAFVLPFVPGLSDADGELAFHVAHAGALSLAHATGQLTVARPLKLAVRGLPSELAITRGEASVAQGHLKLSQITGQLDGGTFALAGQANASFGHLRHYELTFTGERLPLQIGPAITETNARLTLTGNTSDALLAGDIDIVGGRFARKFSLRDFGFFAQRPSLDVPLAQRAPWLKHLALNLSAKSKNGFDVRVDASSFALETVLLSDVKIKGNALAPSATGRVSAQEGQLKFPHGTLSLRHASFDFDPTRRARNNSLGVELAVLAEGEVAPTYGLSADRQSYDITLALGGTLDAFTLDLTSAQGNLSKLDILTLLTTGRGSVGELANGRDETTKLDAAMAFANAQLSEPLTRAASDLIEQRLNVRLELGTEVSQGNLRLTAAKNLHRRLRLETAYSHGISNEQSGVSTRAQLSLTDRLLLEGRAARDLTGQSTSAASGESLQSNLELRLRMLGH